jgi:hypothetical protein
MRDRLQRGRQGGGGDTAAIQAYCISLPAPAVLAEHAFAFLGEEGVERSLIESTRLRQAVGLLIGAHSRCGLRSEGAIDAARVEA